MTERLDVLEGALLHAPIALFALPVPFLLSLAMCVRGAPRIVLFVLAWWSGSGAVMMAIEARARRRRYGRLLALAKGHVPDLPGLTDTVCGLFMSWALRYRLSAGYHRFQREGVDR